jgi:phage tail sheath protein FI
VSIQLSPGVSVKEIDLSNVVPSVATSVGAAVIEATWGPVMDVTTIDSENVLVQRFGKPTASNAANWFAAANFLSYSNNILIVRSDTLGQRNAVSILTGGVDSIPLTSGGAGYTSATVVIDAPMPADSIRSIDVASSGANYNFAPTVQISPPNESSGSQAFAVAILDDTDPLNPIVSRIVVTEPGSGYTEVPSVTIQDNGFLDPLDPSNVVATVGAVTMNTGGVQASGDVILAGGVVTKIEIGNPGSGYFREDIGFYSAYPTATINYSGAAPTDEAAANNAGIIIVDGGLKINNESDYGLKYSNGEATVGEFAAKYPGAIGNSIRVSMADSASFAAWEYRALFEGAPNTSDYAAKNGASNDEVHIVVIDKDGKWTGTPGTVLEVFPFLSKASDARKEDGAGAYYKNAINTQSKYVWWMDHPVIGTNWGVVATGIVFATLPSAITRDLSGGMDHLTATTGQRIDAFDMFSNKEEIDVSLIIAGKSNAIVANYIIQNVVEGRKDCMAFVSPEDKDSGEILVGNSSDIAEKMIAFRNQLPSSSYFVIDSGYKYQYDRYNDAYRWVPLNGDIAGLCARTDSTNDPWFSPAGFNRGQIKNVVKLAYSPRQTDRDNLYKASINPVVSFPGQGVVLFGDKTGQTKPSAFDRINVRRLFIVLQKAISTSAKFQLFDLNDVQSRAQFRSTVEPFLRDVKGRRGIYEFKVVCDETNNTPEVVDNNRFAASIYISPAKSINFIELSFVATRSGVNFSEIAGA